MCVSVYGLCMCVLARIPIQNTNYTDSLEANSLEKGPIETGEPICHGGRNVSAEEFSSFTRPGKKSFCMSMCAKIYFFNYFLKIDSIYFISIFLSANSCS